MSILLILTLIFSISPVGVGAEENSSDISLKNYKKLTEIGDLIEKFKALDYSVILKKDEEKVQDSLIEYQYQGKEDIEGVETDKVSFEMTYKMRDEGDMPPSMMVWIGKENNDIKKMKSDGETIPPQMATKMGKQMLKSVLFPFYSFSKININDLEEWGEVTKSSGKIGENEVTIYEVEIENMPEAEFDSATARVAEFEDFSMIIGYDYVSTKENMDIQFNIENLVLQ